jgi:ComF family protein
MRPALFQRLLSRLPSQCRICHAWPAQALCEGCIERLAQPCKRCLRCALALPGSAEVCGACLKSPPAMDRCLASVSYGFPWTQLIADFKFHEQAGLSRALAQLILATPWVDYAVEQADFLVPIPLSQVSLQTRGFNQAALLAQGLCQPKVHMACLQRVQASPAQHTLSRAKRLRAQAHAFTVPQAHLDHVRGSSVLLVDDVMTTGATLQAAALALRAAGASRVSAVVLARTESPGS